MTYSLSSARRFAVSAIGTGAVAGAMFLGAAPAAEAAPAPMPAVGPVHVAPPAWGGHGGGHGFGGGHGGFGRGGFGHGGFGRGGFGRGFRTGLRPRRLRSRRLLGTPRLLGWSPPLVVSPQ